MKQLIYILLGLIGITLQSCDMRAEYGVPHVRFRLSARVIDEAGGPIEGIEVVTKHGDRFDSRTGVSNYLGVIEASGSVWPGEQYNIEFIDPDGEANGGEFETLTLDITAEIVKVEEGYGGWYEGSYEADLGDITLKRLTKDGE